jgi:1-pyrroline-5-carboxylate dehydrogenase
MNSTTKIPMPVNEPVLSHAPGSPERATLKQAIADLCGQVVEIPVIVGGKEIRTGKVQSHEPAPAPSRWPLHKAGPEVAQARRRARGPRTWSRMPWEHRAAVFLKAADLLAGPYRMVLNAATMLGQSKTAHQAEIDSACELIDFWRFNLAYAEEIHRQQPRSSPGCWNYVDHRPLEGFVFAVTPFNFTSIAGNLPTAPAIMGNTVLWKPAASAMYSAHFIMAVLEAAGLPPGVVNMLPGMGADVGDPVLASPDLAGVHFTGSTATFQGIWETVGRNIRGYRAYPRIVGETGGKDFVFAHPSAEVPALATALVRGAFEFQGQKCSAASRVFIPASLWPALEKALSEQIAEIRVGDVADFGSFMGAVIDRAAFAKIRGTSTSPGAHRMPRSSWAAPATTPRIFIEPTLVLAKRPDLRLMRKRSSARADGLCVRRSRWRDPQDLRQAHLRPDGRGLRPRPRGHRHDRRGAPPCGWELLCQRQADGGRGRPAALRRRPGVGNQRQSGQRAEPAALGEPAHDQGDVRAPDRLPVSLHAAGRLTGGADGRRVSIR